MHEVVGVVERRMDTVCTAADLRGEQVVVVYYYIFFLWLRFAACTVWDSRDEGRRDIDREIPTCSRSRRVRWIAVL